MNGILRRSFKKRENFHPKFFIFLRCHQNKNNKIRFLLAANFSSGTFHSLFLLELFIEAKKIIFLLSEEFSLHYIVMEEFFPSWKNRKDLFPLLKSNIVRI